MSDTYDIVIIGAGPAGMAAARLAAEYKAKTLVLDEQRTPGGQIYRGLSRTEKNSVPGQDEAHRNGLRLIQGFQASSIDYVPGATIWHLSPDCEVGYSSKSVAQMVTARQVILASGAQERPLPVRGWTLPGALTVGAAQILLKESGVGVENAVFVGSGPLLYLAIHQYIEAGIPVKAVIDLTPRRNYFGALRHSVGAVSGMNKIWQGLGWIKEIKKSGIPLIKGAGDIRILGEKRVTGLDYQLAGNWESLQCEHVLLHGGVVPNINISLVAGCETRWNAGQACWNVVVDDWFQSSVANIAVAGDAATIGGAVAAEHSGKIAVLGALQRLGKITKNESDQLVRSCRKAWKAEMKARPFLDALFKIPEHFRIPRHDDIVVCRCEEVNAGEVRENINQGCVEPNQLKSFSRCGMGPCQGRFCGLTVSEMIADALNMPVSEVGYYRLRPPIKPVPLEELSNMKFPAED